MGINKLLEFEILSHLLSKFLNLINQANPVATTPRYNKDRVEDNEGFESPCGVSKLKKRV